MHVECGFHAEHASLPTVSVREGECVRESLCDSSCVSVCASVHVCMCVCARVCMCECVHVHVNVCASVSVHVEGGFHAEHIALPTMSVREG